MIKQVIVMRKDLNMRKGKMAAQAAHASMKVFFDKIQFFDGDSMRIGNISEEMKEWVQGTFTKIVVGCNSEQELLLIKEKANLANLPSSIICDAGSTEFHGQPTTTCVAIGPAEASKIDEITKDLPLL